MDYTLGRSALNTCMDNEKPHKMLWLAMVVCIVILIHHIKKRFFISSVSVWNKVRASQVLKRRQVRMRIEIQLLLYETRFIHQHGHRQVTESIPDEF